MRIIADSAIKNLIDATLLAVKASSLQSKANDIHTASIGSVARTPNDPMRDRQNQITILWCHLLQGQRKSCEITTRLAGVAPNFLFTQSSLWRRGKFLPFVKQPIHRNVQSTC